MGASPTTPRFSADFVHRFRGVLCDVYAWPDRDGAVEVRNWQGRLVLSMLPHLSYIDLDVAAAKAVAAELNGRRFLIRVLGDPKSEFQSGEPVTMRVALGGHTNASLAQMFDSDRMTRKNLNRARRIGLTATCTSTGGDLAYFLKGLSRTLHRLGSPMVPSALIAALVGSMDSDLVLIHDGPQVVAGLLLMHDDEISWVPWSFNHAPEPVRGAGDLAFVTAAEIAFERGAAILDFGRSPYGSGAFHYKERFGAVPHPIVMLRSGVPDPYAYAGGPQKLWSSIPFSVANVLGPKVCRFLPEY